MENLNLLRKIAWSFHRSTHVEYKELFSEACLAYCESISQYTADKGALSTYIWTVIENRLILFTKKERRYVPINLQTESEKQVCYQPIPFTEVMAEFSTDCRKVAELMLQLVEDRGEETVNTQNKMVLWKVKKMLIEQEGWSHGRANKGIKQLKITVASL